MECFIKNPICFQATSPSCTDLILTNKKEFFKNSNFLEVGISDHHSLVNGNAKTKLYQNYNSFDVKRFKEDLKKNLKSNNTVISLIFKKSVLQSSINMLPLRKKSSDLIIGF